MIPLRDAVKSRSTPFVNYALIVINLGVFIYEATLPSEWFRRLMIGYGLVPAQLNVHHPFAYLTLVSSMFLHGSWVHVLSNMWVLFIFGDNVEDRMGHGRYLAFYLLAGLAAGLVQAAFAAHSSVPTIGASGAIAGVLGAYLLFYPRGRVLTVIPLFIFPWLMEIPAFVFLGLWFLLQLWSGVMALGQLGSAQVSGIAWWAHVGGFAFGLLAARAFAHRRQGLFA